MCIGMSRLKERKKATCSTCFVHNDWHRSELFRIMLQTGWPSNAALQGRVQEGHTINHDLWEAAADDCSDLCRVVQTVVKRAEG